jgi:hypothetical protein
MLNRIYVTCYSVQESKKLKGDETSCFAPVAAGLMAMILEGVGG